MNIIDIATFKERIGHLLVPVMFWIIVAGSVFSGVKLINTGGPVLGILVILGVSAIARIVGEVLLSIFEINNQLNKK